MSGIVSGTNRCRNRGKNRKRPHRRQKDKGRKSSLVNAVRPEKVKGGDPSGKGEEGSEHCKRVEARVGQLLWQRL